MYISFQSFKDLDYIVKDKVLLENLLDIECYEVADRGYFYNGNLTYFKFALNVDKNFFFFLSHMWAEYCYSHYIKCLQLNCTHLKITNCIYHLKNISLNLMTSVHSI